MIAVEPTFPSPFADPMLEVLGFSGVMGLVEMMFFGLPAGLMAIATTPGFAG